MAGFEIAYNWMMDNEDARRECAIVPDAPPGAHAISGINSAAFPTLYAYIAAIPQAQRESAVKDFYQKEFWNTWYEQLTSDDVAKRVFDEAVNAGPGTAVKLLQEGLTASLGVFVAVDGEWGPQTVQHANSVASDALVSAYKAARVQRYRDIVKANPADAQYLEEWIQRAEK
jgi:lysozyme family protein